MESLVKLLKETAEPILQEIDPTLDYNNITIDVFEEKEFNEKYYDLMFPRYHNIAPVESVHGVSVPNKRYILLREMEFYPTLNTYFHEMGHVAIDGLIKLPDTSSFFNDLAIDRETMAYSFQHYAMEQLDEKNNLMYLSFFLLPPQFIQKTKRQKLREIEAKISDLPTTGEHIRALMEISDTLEKSRNFKETYFKLKRKLTGKC